MKRLLISTVFPPHVGGSGRWFWEIYRRLPADQYLLAVGEHPEQAAFDHSHHLNVIRMPLAMPTWGTLNWDGLRGYLRNFRTISRLVRQHNINQIHCGTLLPEGWIGLLAKRRFGIPYLCYVHGEEMNIGRQSRELGWMMRKVLRSAHLVIANSQNTATVLQSQWLVNDRQLRLMHPGVDIERFVPAARNAEVRRRLGWNDRSVVLTVGRLQARKGQDHFILAMDQIRRAQPNLLYVIIGDGEQRAYLEQLIRERRLQESVQLRINCDDDDLIHCYQQCDLFALPNREVNGDFEGFGMVLLEAQACGRPVLAGTSGGTAETLLPGKTGRVVCCEQNEPLARVVIELLSDRQKVETMGQAARQWVVERFDWKVLSRQANELFESLLLPTKAATAAHVRGMGLRHGEVAAGKVVEA
jgi:phosphatidylinositol alpha-1,6-mannosyltransferase